MALGLTTPLLAHADAPIVDARPLSGSKWALDYAPHECVASRAYVAGTTPAILSLSLRPSTSTAWLRIGVKADKER